MPGHDLEEQRQVCPDTSAGPQPSILSATCRLERPAGQTKRTGGSFAGVTFLIVLAVVVVVLIVGASLAVPLLIRRVGSSMGQRVAGLVQGQSGADTIQQHSGELSQLEGLAGRLGIHLDLADDLGTKMAGTGMQQPTQGMMHVVGRSAPDPKVMRGPCTIAYAIEAPGVPAFSDEQIFEVWTAQWPEPGGTLPCVYDAANPAHVDIEWPQVQSSGDKALGDAQALATELNQPQPPPAAGT
jgi:hypothetical protein